MYIQANPAPVVDIVFEKPKKNKDPHSSMSNPTTIADDAGLPAAHLNRDSILAAVHEVRPSAAVFTVLAKYVRPDHCESVQTTVPVKLPPTLQSLHNRKCSAYSMEELRRMSRGVFATISITEEATLLERSTRQQSRSCTWYDHRVGRITASKFYMVCHFSGRNYPTSIVKSIMQYSKDISRLPQIQWGIQNESTARNQYIDMLAPKHINLKVEPVGLVVNPKLPYLGASPDGIVTCDCCGVGLLEIKCPYKYRSVDPHTIAGTDFFLGRNSDGELHLKTSHSYYYQVQGQLAICGREYCDFVCWTTNGLYTERISFDHELFDSIRPQLEQFFQMYLLPELLSRNLESGTVPEQPQTSFADLQAMPDITNVIPATTQCTITCTAYAGRKSMD